jgi:hypothetical protein
MSVIIDIGFGGPQRLTIKWLERGGTSKGLPLIINTGPDSGNGTELQICVVATNAAGREIAGDVLIRQDRNTGLTSFSEEQHPVAKTSDFLRCGCSVNGHKCLVSQGGCGNCTGHCTCAGGPCSPERLTNDHSKDLSAKGLKDNNDLLTRTIRFVREHMGIGDLETCTEGVIRVMAEHRAQLGSSSRSRPITEAVLKSEINRYQNLHLDAHIKLAHAEAEITALRQSVARLTT